MNNSPHNAYQQRVKEAETPAETDAAVLENAALILEAAKEIPGEEDFYLALNFNQRIWTVIQTFVSEDCPWPENIKCNLMSLSIFIDKQTYKAMSEDDPKKLDAMININRQIAAGFRSVPDETPKPEETE